MKPSWEERWQLKQEEPIPAADPWLINHAQMLTGGSALDLACGRGRNSLFLAKSDYQVLAIDSAPTALLLLRDITAQQQLAIEIRQHNLESGLPHPLNQTDLCLCFYYLQRNLFTAIKNSIKTGGLFIGRSFCASNRSKDPRDTTFEPNELAELFADWEILDYEEGLESPARGGTLAGIVARKP